MKLLRFYSQWCLVNGAMVALVILGLHLQQAWA